MKKQLPTDIMNELAGSSVFFTAKPQPVSPLAQAEEAETPVSARAGEPHFSLGQSPQRQGATIPSNRDTTTKRLKAATQPSHLERTQASLTRSDTASMLETIRKTVRQVGKEAATHRFKAEEKAALADIVYVYSRKGRKTSENEMTRIAVNWLLLDYQERGDGSMLAQVLDALHR